MQTYNIYYSGGLLNITPENAQLNLAETFHKSPEQFQKWFSGKEICINQNLTQENALERIDLLTKLGLLVYMKPFNITEIHISPENIYDSTVAAGFWVRLVAFAIDAFMSVLVLFLITPMMGLWTEMSGGLVQKACTAVLYFSGCAIFFKGGTLGKNMLGIMVVDVQGQRLKLRQSGLRAAGYFISGFTLLIGFIMVIFTPKKRALHDLIANTYVVFKNKVL